jgi:hypothetical protein
MIAAKGEDCCADQLPPNDLSFDVFWPPVGVKLGYIAIEQDEVAAVFLDCGIRDVRRVEQRPIDVWRHLSLHSADESKLIDASFREVGGLRQEREIRWQSFGFLCGDNTSS